MKYPLILLFISLSLAYGCKQGASSEETKSGDNDTTTTTARSPATAYHTVNKLGYWHGTDLLYPYGHCDSCHGADLTGGSGKSCYTCHGVKWRQ